jgi:hypothetical protein
MPKFCTQCGEALYLNCKFCGECGAKVVFAIGYVSPPTNLSNSGSTPENTRKATVTNGSENPDSPRNRCVLKSFFLSSLTIKFYLLFDIHSFISKIKKSLNFNRRNYPGI